MESCASVSPVPSQPPSMGLPVPQQCRQSCRCRCTISPTARSAVEPGARPPDRNHHCGFPSPSTTSTLRDTPSAGRPRPRAPACRALRCPAAPCHIRRRATKTCCTLLRMPACQRLPQRATPPRHPRCHHRRHHGRRRCVPHGHRTTP
jgi:hypothetical protein